MEKTLIHSTETRPANIDGALLIVRINRNELPNVDIHPFGTWANGKLLYLAVKHDDGNLPAAILNDLAQPVCFAGDTIWRLGGPDGRTITALVVGEHNLPASAYTLNTPEDCAWVYLKNGVVMTDTEFKADHVEVVA